MGYVKPCDYPGFYGFQEEDVPESATNSTDCVDKYVNSVIHGAVRTLLTDRAGKNVTWHN